MLLMVQSGRMLLRMWASMVAWRSLSSGIGFVFPLGRVGAARRLGVGLFGLSGLGLFCFETRPRYLRNDWLVLGEW